MGPRLRARLVGGAWAYLWLHTCDLLLLFICDIVLSFLSCPKYTNPTLAIMLTTGNAGRAGCVLRRALLFSKRVGARSLFSNYARSRGCNCEFSFTEIAPPIKINKDHTVSCYNVGRTYLDIKMKI